MALFKIFNNIDNNTHPLPTAHHKGYMYFDASKKLFYIDLADDSDNVQEKRAPINAWVSQYAEKDGQENIIHETYLKTADLDITNVGSAEKVNHTLTFGANQTYVYDGSADVTVPVYMGTII